MAASLDAWHVLLSRERKPLRILTGLRSRTPLQPPPERFLAHLDLSAHAFSDGDHPSDDGLDDHTGSQCKVCPVLLLYSFVDLLTVSLACPVLVYAELRVPVIVLARIMLY